MHYYFTAVSLIAGICLGFGVLHLFIGLRRKDHKLLNLTFALFALCYAATLFNGIRWYSTSNISEYITINRIDAVFVTGAFVSLIWYVSFYTDYQPRIILSWLSLLLIIPGLVLIIFPEAFIGEVSGLTSIALPWGEELANLIHSGSIWFDLVLIARLAALVYIIIALVHQYRHGNRKAAGVLSLGMLPFLAGIFY